MTIQLHDLGLVPYEATWHAMQRFTAERSKTTRDEIWLCQHPPVYTLGQAGKTEHWLQNNGIPLIKVDRGGQITYHGPGQIVIYLLFDVVRRQIKVHELVRRIEEALIALLAAHQVKAFRLAGAPGVYVGDATDPAKIAALGLRVRKNGCYHGLSFNVDMDLSPFNAINPCGYAGMRVTQSRDLGITDNVSTLAQELITHLAYQLGFTLGTS